ncbi:MAG: VOC family protein [Pirellulales bacterium]
MSNKIHDVYPYLRVRDANAAIEFYKKAFSAEEDFRLCEPGGRVGHAELTFGSFTVMLSDEYPEYGVHSPEKFGGTGSSIHLHVEDIDAMTKQAEAAGAKVIMPPTDMFYGERSSKLLDPFGHEWMLGSQIEKVSRDEMQRRFNEMLGSSEEK